MASETFIKQLKDWQELTQLTRGRPFVVEKIRLLDNDVVVEGPFELPQLAKLSMEDQVFVTAFIQADGSIKEMERVFGVSYPTIKNRLSRIAGSLEFVDTNHKPTRTEVLDRLKRGEITAEQAIQLLEELK